MEGQAHFHRTACALAPRQGAVHHALEPPGRRRSEAVNGRAPSGTRHQQPGCHLAREGRPRREAADPVRLQPGPAHPLAPGTLAPAAPADVHAQVTDTRGDGRPCACKGRPGACQPSRRQGNRFSLTPASSSLPTSRSYTLLAPEAAAWAGALTQTAQTSTVVVVVVVKEDKAKVMSA